MWEDTGNGWWEPVVDTSYDQPMNVGTVASDIVTQRQDVGTSGNDAWGGFFNGLGKTAGALLDYGIKRDAAMVGAELQAKQFQMQRYGSMVPIAGTQGGKSLTINPMLLLIGGIVLFVGMKK